MATTKRRTKTRKDSRKKKRVVDGNKKTSANINVGEDSNKQADKVLNWTVNVAVAKSGLSILLGIIFLVGGLWSLYGLVELSQRLGLLNQTRPIVEYWQMLMSSVDPHFVDIPSAVVSSLILFITFTSVMVIVFSPGVLFFIGYKLLTRETIEKELDRTGNLILRLRSGLGHVKPLEELIQSIFGRSRSAWELRLWAATVAFWLGVIVLIVSILQLIFPGLFVGVDKAIFFGSGVGAGLLSLAMSYWLNPAEKLQEALSENAQIELAVISFIKQTELVDGWMNRALLSLKADKDWSPENAVFQSIKENTTVIQAALKDSNDKIVALAQHQNPALSEESTQ